VFESFFGIIARQGQGMQDFSAKLRIWGTQTTARPKQEDWTLAGPHYSDDFATLLACQEGMRCRHRMADGVEPFSLQWFMEIETVRHSRQGKWLPSLLEFSKHRGETLLGIGAGLGTDWVQYARHGAEVIACCPSAENLAVVRRNFQLRGLAAKSLLVAEPTALPLESGSIDVACLTWPLGEQGGFQAVVNELYRVLKPGGKILALAPAKYDIDFWFRVCVPWHTGRGGEGVGIHRFGQTRFSGRTLGKLFSCFHESRVYKRHLRRAEVPHVWRWMPMPLLQRLMGRVLVYKGFKPLSAAISDLAAA
jgi:SAM-dependent methyltransferase